MLYYPGEHQDHAAMSQKDLVQTGLGNVLHWYLQQKTKQTSIITAKWQQTAPMHHDNFNSLRSCRIVTSATAMHSSKLPAKNQRKGYRKFYEVS